MQLGKQELILNNSNKLKTRTSTENDYYQFNMQILILHSQIIMHICFSAIFISENDTLTIYTLWWSKGEDAINWLSIRKRRFGATSGTNSSTLVAAISDRATMECRCSIQTLCKKSSLSRSFSQLRPLKWAQ